MPSAQHCSSWAEAPGPRPVLLLPRKPTGPGGHVTLTPAALDALFPPCAARQVQTHIPGVGRSLVGAGLSWLRPPQAPRPLASMGLPSEGAWRREPSGWVLPLWGCRWGPQLWDGICEIPRRPAVQPPLVSGHTWWWCLVSSARGTASSTQPRTGYWLRCGMHCKVVWTCPPPRQAPIG